MSVQDRLVADLRRRIRHGRRSPLARACGAGPGLRVHDALAGWGADGLTLAGLGCHVHMSEIHPDVFAILETHAERFRCSDLGVGATLTWRLEDGSRRWRRSADAPRPFDVIYLDPMFGRHPKTALPKARMQRLGMLAPTPSDAQAEALVAAASLAASSRVVVKRRRRSAPYGEPSWQIVGRSVRFDVYRPG